MPFEADLALKCREYVPLNPLSPTAVGLVQSQSKDYATAKETTPPLEFSSRTQALFPIAKKRKRSYVLARAGETQLFPGISFKFISLSRRYTCYCEKIAAAKQRIDVCQL